MPRSIDVPAEHVGVVREALAIELESAGEDVQWSGDYRQQREGAKYFRAVIDAMDQVGWEGEAPCSLTADRKLADYVFTRAFEYARERVSEAEPDGMPDLLKRVEWLAGVVASLEAEAVAA